MEKVIYSNKGGLGIILEDFDNQNDFIEPKAFKVNNDNLIPGMKTNLNGLFNEEVYFLGCLKNEKNCMIFFLGEEENLFDKKRYYSCFYWISENKLANKYTENSARDFNWINGCWK